MCSWFHIPQAQRHASFKIIDHDLPAHALEYLLHKFNVLRMHLIIILRLLVRENQIERHLIALIHHGTMAAGHLADVETATRLESASDICSRRRSVRRRRSVARDRSRK